MTKHRYYIQREAEKPEFDLWMEMNDEYSAVPEIHICYTGKNRKEVILNLALPTAIRMYKALTEMLDLCSKPFDDYVAEDND